MSQITDHTNPLQSMSHEELCGEVLRLRAEVVRLSKAELEARAASAPPSQVKNAPQRNTTPRRRLSDERVSYTATFRLRYFHSDGSPDIMRLYFVVGEYDDGKPGEVFITADRTGSMARGALDVVGVLLSLLLQYGIPVEEITKKLRGTRFLPDGWTGNSSIPNCTSPLDLLARWLELRYVKEES